MAKPRTSMYLDGHTYSLFDPEEIHRDLRLDPARARAVMARSRSVIAAHEFCEECQDLSREVAAKETAAAGYPSLDDAILAHRTNQTKFMISRSNLARMLQLGPGETVERMWVTDDPLALYVAVAGDHFTPVFDGEEIPLSKASRIKPAGAAAAPPPAR